MSGQDRLDLARRIGTQGVLKTCQVHRASPTEIKYVDLDPTRPRHLGPSVTEPAGCRHQHPFTRRDQIGKQRLPRRMSVANVNRDFAARSGHSAEILDKRLHHLNQFTRIDVGGCAMHGLKNPVRDD